MTTKAPNISLPRSRLGHRVITGARWSAAASGVSGGLGLLQLIVLARLLGPSTIGVMALATVVVELGRVLGNLGLSEAVIQRKDPTRAELSSLYWLAVLMGATAAALVSAVAPVAARAFGVPELVSILPIIALKLMIVGLGIQFQASLRKHLRFGVLAAATIAGSMAGFVVAVMSAAFFDQGVWALVWGVLANASVQSAIFSWHGWRRTDRPYFHFSLGDLRGYVRFGLLRSGASMLDFATTRVDQMLIGALMGPRILGLYSVAIDLSRQPVSRLLPTVAVVAFPALSSVQDEPRRLRAGYLRMLGLLMFVLVPGFLGLAAIAPVAVPLFFGSRWVDAVPLVQILSVAVLLSSFASVSRSVTSATGHVHWDFYWYLLSAVLLPPVIFLAARTGDAATVAASLLAFNAVLAVGGYHFVLRRILGPFMVELLRTALVPMIGAVLMGGLVTAGVHLVRPLPPAMQFAILALTGAAFYLGFAFSFQRELARSYISLVQPSGGSRPR